MRFVVSQTAYASKIQVHKLLVSCLWRRRQTFFTTVSRHALYFKCEVFLYHVSWYFLSHTFYGCRVEPMMHIRIIIHGQVWQALTAHNLCIRAIKLSSAFPEFELWIKPMYAAFVEDWHWNPPWFPTFLWNSQELRGKKEGKLIEDVGHWGGIVSLL